MDEISEKEKNKWKSFNSKVFTDIFLIFIKENLIKLKNKKAFVQNMERRSEKK
jgi:hypothetical protein